MYAISTVFVLMSIVMFTNAAVAIFPAQEKPPEFADQEGCYLEHLQKVIPYGDYNKNGSCYKYTCHPSNMTQVFTCGVAITEARSPCELISDQSLDYPDCCPMVICHTIPIEATNEGSREKTTDVLEADPSLTSEIAIEETTAAQVSENLTASADSEETTDVLLLKYLSNIKSVDEKTSEQVSTSESTSEKTIAVPIVEHVSSSETEGVPLLKYLSNSKSVDEKTSDVTVLENLPTSESTSEKAIAVPMVEHVSSSETEGVPLLKYLSNSKSVDEKASDVTVLKNLPTSESTSEKTTVVPVDKSELSDETEVPGKIVFLGLPYDPYQSQPFGYDFINELLIAQASRNR